MKSQWKILGKIDTEDRAILIAKLRTEIEIIISPKTIDNVKSWLNNIIETTEQKEENQRFKEEFEDILSLYYDISESNPKHISLINTEWMEFNGKLTLEVLIKLRDALDDVTAFRIEGTPKYGMFMVFNIGSELIRKPATEESLANARIAFYDLTTTEISASKLETINTILEAIGVAIDLWRLYREEQQFARERMEQERKQKENEARGLERDMQRGAVHSDGGGPAFGDRVERIGRTC